MTTVRYSKVRQAAKLKYFLALPAIALIGVFVFGYMVIAKGQTRYGEELQNKIWHTIIDKGTNDIRTIDASISYTDNGRYEFKPSKFLKNLSMASNEELKEMDKQYSFTVSKLNLGMKTSGYTDLSNIEVPKTDSHMEAWLKNNKKNYAGSIDLKLKENEAFVKYDYSSDTKDFIAKLSGGESDDPNKNKWQQIKDEWQLDELRNSLTMFIKPEQNPAYEQLLKDNRLFDIKNLKGGKVINGRATVQYELVLNKTRLRNLVSESLALTFDGSDPEAQDFAEDIMFALIDKIEVREFNVWIGVSDGKLYKSTMTSNALSVSKTLAQLEKSINDPKNGLGQGIGAGLEEARAKSRDAKRLADARQIASALELYYNDNGQYPAAQNGRPMGISPTYISEMPKEPTPADGNCTDYDNIYWYYRLSPNNYKFMFCLGGDTGGIKSGVVVMTEAGIESTVPYDYGQEDAEQFEAIKAAVLDAIKAMKFDAKVKMDYTAKNVGKRQEIKSPKSYIKAPDYDPVEFWSALTPEISMFQFDK